MARNRATFDCNNCKLGRHCDESNPAPFKKFCIPGVIESNTCFVPMVTQRAAYLLRLHSHYKNQILFSDGGLMAQPNPYLEAMEEIERLVNAR